MNIPELKLDNLTWADLVDLARRAIPAASEGQWTLHGPVDPGITLVELFAAELEQRLYMLDRVPDTFVRAVMRLLLGPTAGPRPARPAVAVLSLSAPAGAVPLPACTEVQRDTGSRLVLTTEHRVLVVPGATVTAFEVDGIDRWPRLRAGEPAPVFGTRGDADAFLQLRADAPAPEHRLYLAIEEPTLARGWRAGTEPPAPPGRRLAATAPQGLGWARDGGHPVFLDPEGTRLPADRLGALAIPADAAPRWQVQVGDRWWDLQVEDGTAGLRVSGVVRLRPPPGRTFPASARIRIRRPAKAGAPVNPWVSAVAVNAVVARHRRRRPYQDPHPGPVPPLPGRELRLDDAAPNATEPLDRLLDGRGQAWITVRHGSGTTETWRAVDDLAFSGPGSRHLVIDRDQGLLRFGDGRNGRIPRWGEDATLEGGYWLGGGTPPEVGPGTVFGITRASSGSRALAATTVTPLVWGQDRESQEVARARAAQELLRATRVVTAADVAELVKAVPGVRVARVHVQPGRDPDHPGAVVPDALAVYCLPVVQRREPGDLLDVPAPELDRWSLRALARALERARLVGSRISVHGPAWRRIDLEVELAVSADDGGAVPRRAELALRHLLDPLVGGPRGEGWAFGAPVHPADLSVVVQRTLGRQGDVLALRIREAGGDDWTDCEPMPLHPFELPRIEGLRIFRSGPPGGDRR